MDVGVDLDAFDAFVVEHRTRLVRSAVLLGNSVHDAEDLTHTALTRCLNDWHRVSAAERPTAYAYRVLVNVWKDARSRRWTGEVPTETLLESSHDPDWDTGLIVRAALRELPREQREVLVLRYYADLSERDTAAALGVRPGTVKSRASRALETLSRDPQLARSSSC
jgi:RNA polymerase sigma-70 factor (sigma-E family)